MLVNRFFIFLWKVHVMIFRPEASRASLEFRGGGGGWGGIPWNSLWGRDARFSKSWPYFSYFRQKMVIFFTRFQTWCRQILCYHLRLERQEKDFVKAISNLPITLSFLFISNWNDKYGLAFPNSLDSDQNKQSLYNNTRFQTKTAQTPYPLGRNIVREYPPEASILASIVTEFRSSIWLRHWPSCGNSFLRWSQFLRSLALRNILFDL